MGMSFAWMRRRVGGAFRAGVSAAVVVVGCGGRTADWPPDDGSGSAVASGSGVANATSGAATGSATGTVTETAGAFIGASGTIMATSGTVFFGAPGTVAATAGTTVTGPSACGAGASVVPVSFANDLMPILQSTCSVGGTDD